MTEYEIKRIRLQLIHIIATLGVPFVVVALNEYFRGNYDKRRESQPIIVECVTRQGTSREVAKQPEHDPEENSEEYAIEW